MARDVPEITAPLTPGKIRDGIETIVERLHPRPRGADCLPVHDLEQNLTAYATELVRVAYNDAQPARPTIRSEDLTEPELAALEAWNRGSADTTGMLYAVRAAIAQVDRSEDARLAIAERKNQQLAAKLAEVEAKLRRVETIKCWTNEDGRRFVFVTDLQEALGVPRDDREASRG